MFTIFYDYPNTGLLILRLALGIIFLVHGIKKLNGSMGAFMLIIGIVETLAAIAMVTGMFTQLAAIGIVVVMLGAIYMKISKWNVPFTSMEKMGWEFDLIMLASALGVFVLGPGGYALDVLWK